MPTISARLERIPFCRPHFKMLVMGGLGFALEALDAGIIAFILPSLREQWHLTSLQTGFLASATYIGFMIGALFAGLLGDRWGRKTVMMWALVIFSLMSVANALVTSWQWFFVLRALGGLGMGAEGAIIAPFLSEFVSSRYRGRFTGALAGFFSFGFVASALIGYFVVPLSDNGWRWALIITALPVVVLVWWRRSLDESPRWMESKGRHEEAIAIVERLETEAERRLGEQLPPAEEEALKSSTTIHHASLMQQLISLWQKPLTGTTAMVWTFWFCITFCYYAFLTWIPSLLVQQGFSIASSFSYTIAIFVAQIPGYYSAAYFNDKIGRRATIVSYMLLACISAISLALITGPTGIVIAAICLSFSMNGVNAGQYAYTPELYPTHIRATGMGAASAFARIGAIMSPTIIGAIYPVVGFAGVFGMTTVVLAIGGVVVLIYGINTTGKSLEHISTELQSE